MQFLYSEMPNLALMLLLVLINGFFVASEFALVSIRRTRVDEMIGQGVRGARAVGKAIGDLDRYIAGTQVGITLASLALGWTAEPALVHLLQPIFSLLPISIPEPAIHTAAIVLAFVVITFLHVVIGELIPKTLALQAPEKVSLVCSAPLTICIFLFRPLIWSLNGSGNWVLRRFGISANSHHQHIHSVEELDIIVQQSHEAGVFDDLEKRILQRAFSFSELVASEVMIPRIDLEMVDIDSPLDETLNFLAESIHTRYPVYERNEDNIIGIVMVRDVFNRLRKDPANLSIRKILRNPLFVPESIRLDDLLTRFRESRTHTALVVDEHGALAGLVSLKDLVEELFGEIPDVLEADQPNIRKLNDGRIVIRGDVALHEVSAATDIDLVDDEVDTIAGYTLKQLGRIAKVGDSIDTPVGKIIVTDVTQMRIVQVTLLPKAQPVETD